MNNVIMILCDELRADMLGCMGNEQVKTPHLDDLSKDCVVFEQAYCNSPMCVPSRVSIATGRYAHSHGALDNMLSPLDDEKSFYKTLQDKGYHTFNHGKWHCNINPLKFGMDSHTGGGTDQNDIEKKVTCFGITDRELRKKTDYGRNNGEVPLIIYGTRPSHKDDTLDSLVTANYLSDLDALTESGEIRKQPIFARLSIMDPHTPYIPAEPYASMYKPEDIDLPVSFDEDLTGKPVLQKYFMKARGFDQVTEEEYRKSKASYQGLVTPVDDRVGKVIKSLKDKDLYDESLLIFIADHGSMMGEHGFIEKWGYMYDQVVRIPLMIKLPESMMTQDMKGKHLDSFVESVDILPTVMEVLGIEQTIEEAERVQGRSLLPYMTGQVDKHKDKVFSQYYCGSLQNKSALMVRDNKYKLTSYPEGTDLEGFLPNDHPLKMSQMFDRDSVLGELYDLEKDPDEVNNLFDDPEYRQIKEKYLQELDKWMKSLGDVVDEATMPAKNPLSFHVIRQGENMLNAQAMLEGEKRWGKLKRKSFVC